MVGNNKMTEILQELGFTVSESKAYLNLLELSEATIGTIIKKSEISSGKAYLVLDGLVKKRVVSVTQKNGVNHYAAKDPENLYTLIDEETKKLQKLRTRLETEMEQFKERYNQKKQSTSVQVYRGKKGIQKFHDWILTTLKLTETLRIMNAPTSLDDSLQNYFANWNQQRADKKITMEVLFDGDKKVSTVFSRKLPFTKIATTTHTLPVCTIVFQDYVATITYQPSPVCIVIQNKATAHQYTQHFKQVWKDRAKEI